MCDDVILPTEKVMKFKSFLYHDRCFCCTYCQKYFQRGEYAAIPEPKTILCAMHHSLKPQQQHQQQHCDGAYEFSICTEA